MAAGSENGIHGSSNYKPHVLSSNSGTPAKKQQNNSVPVRNWGKSFRKDGIFPPENQPLGQAEEIKSLRKELAQVKLENEILKKRRRTSQKRACKARLDQNSCYRIPNGSAVQNTLGQRERLRCMATAKTVTPAFAA